MDPPVSALVDSLARARWLEPDASMDALDAAALDEIEARFDELATALGALRARGEHAVERFAVRTTRSFDEACLAFVDAWALVRGEPAPFGRARAIARGAAARAWPQDRRRALDTALHELGYTARSRAGGAWRASFGDESFTPLPAGQVLATREAEWRLAYGASVPSPWAPLLALHLRGVWPMILRDGHAIVWVPARDASGRLVDDPVSRRPIGRLLSPSIRGEPEWMLTALDGIGVAVLPASVPAVELEPLSHEASPSQPGAVFDVGRHPGCSLVVRDARLARRDALFVSDGRALRVHDLGTAAGQFVNGRRARSGTELRDGDTWSVNPAHLRVRFSPTRARRDGARGLLVSG